MSDQQTAAMLCPLDRTALVMSERQGIEIDYCPSCRGVWLDRGELDKILERSAAESEPARPPAVPTLGGREDYSRSRDYGHRDFGDDRGNRHGGHRKPKSFLSELFD
ncbi:zf-TFIIB domain-containing protein [Sphingomonas sp.]|uniref:TFIIB-type zinc ribbon-containing protein n=1 Tax=Sphingomonas sp. TaxID=28214 RepID=UPI00286D9CE8|nr:zf-TFIIB domain-containing protein [Sphingomonas sp.]